MDRSLQKLHIETQQEIKEIIDKEKDKEKDQYIGGKISHRSKCRKSRKSRKHQKKRTNKSRKHQKKRTNKSRKVKGGDFDISDFDPNVNYQIQLDEERRRRELEDQRIRLLQQLQYEAYGSPTSVIGHPY